MEKCLWKIPRKLFRDVQHPWKSLDSWDQRRAAENVSRDVRDLYRCCCSPNSCEVNRTAPLRHSSASVGWPQWQAVPIFSTKHSTPSFLPTYKGSMEIFWNRNLQPAVSCHDITAGIQRIHWTNSPSFEERCHGTDHCREIDQRQKADNHRENSFLQRSSKIQMGVSKNNGTPKWMVYNGNPY